MVVSPTCRKIIRYTICSKIFPKSLARPSPSSRVHVCGERLALASSFLPGIPRASILHLAAATGYKVSERNFTVDELLQLVATYEAALSGTAATLSPVGCLVYNGKEIVVRDGGAGPNVQKLRAALQDIQKGVAPDTHDWLTPV